MNLQQALEITVKKIQSMNEREVTNRLSELEGKDFVNTLNHLLDTKAMDIHEESELRSSIVKKDSNSNVETYEFEMYSTKESCIEKILSNHNLSKNTNFFEKPISSSDMGSFEKDYLLAA